MKEVVVFLEFQYVVWIVEDGMIIWDSITMVDKYPRQPHGLNEWPNKILIKYEE